MVKQRSRDLFVVVVPRHVELGLPQVRIALCVTYARNGFIQDAKGCPLKPLGLYHDMVRTFYGCV